MINKSLTASASITVNTSPTLLWEVLTNPELIKVYLYGTETITDWKVGSPIVFQGEYEGQKYKDKGVILENQLHEKLSYSYWSGFSGLEDKPENFSDVSYTLEADGHNKTVFTWTQRGFANETGQKHSETGLPALLAQIKELAENQAQ